MYDEAILTGWVSSVDEPDWGPLERFLPLELCGRFMWMHATTLEDGRELQAYKHSDTRRYILLDAHADAYENLDHGRFRRMRHSDAIEQVLHTGWVLSHADDAEKAAVCRALEAAWERGNGDQAAGAHILPSSPACATRVLPASPAQRPASWSPGKDSQTVPVGTLSSIRKASGLEDLR